MLNAIFFDLDETLIDGSGCHLEAGRRTFAAYGMDYDEAKRRTGDFSGIRMREILPARRDAVGKNERDAPSQDLLNVRQEQYLELMPEYVALMPGAREALQSANEVASAVAIVSSETEQCIAAVLAHFGLTNLISFVVGANGVTLGKPHPEPYQAAFERVREKQPVFKRDCLVVEDSAAGVRSGQAAGIPVCLVPFSHTPVGIEAEYKVESLLDLPSLLKSLSTS